MESSYIIEGDEDEFSISTPFNHGFLLFLSVIGGIAVIITGFLVHLTVLLMGFIVLIGPWAFLSWKAPNKVTFDRKNAKISLWYNIFKSEEIKIRAVNDCFVERYWRHTFVSTYEDGNKEYVYEFFVRLKSLETKSILRVTSRKRIDKIMQEFVRSLDDFLLLCKQKGNN